MSNSRPGENRGYDRLQSPSEQRITGGGNGDNDGEERRLRTSTVEVRPMGMPTGGSRTRCSIGDERMVQASLAVSFLGRVRLPRPRRGRGAAVVLQHRWEHTATPSGKFTRAAFATCSLASPTADPPRRGLT